MKFNIIDKRFTIHLCCIERANHPLEGHFTLFTLNLYLRNQPVALVKVTTYRTIG